MCRIIEATSEDGEVEIDGRMLKISIKNKAILKLRFVIHLDGRMSKTICKIRFSWKFAPETLNTRSSDGVHFPSNRLGGEIIVPARVTGFDSRKVVIEAKWVKKQIEQIGKEFSFSLTPAYLETENNTVLIESGRGISGPTRVPVMATSSMIEANVEYTPINIIDLIGEFRIRSFDDGSTHIDKIGDENPHGLTLDNYDFINDFRGIDSDMGYLDEEIRTDGLPSFDLADGREKVRKMLEFCMSIVATDDFSSPDVSKYNLNEIALPLNNWLERNLESEKDNLMKIDSIMACICLTRLGMKIGGRSGKRISKHGIEIGAHLFELSNSTPIFGEHLLISDFNDRGEISYFSDVQIFAIVAMIHMKKAGYKINKSELESLVNQIKSGIKIFRTEKSFFRSLDHFFSDSKPVEVSTRDCVSLLTTIGWIDKIAY